MASPKSSRRAVAALMSEKAAQEKPAEPAHRVVTLRPEAILSIILSSVSDVLTVMRICVPAIQGADLTKPKEAREAEPPAGNRIPFSFDLNDTRAPDVRKATCLNWILARGFQELARAVRTALEQAHIYLAVIDFTAGKDVKWSDFQGAMASAHKEATKLNFPNLLEAVNKRLKTPLHFEDEFLSFQKVRNCLEHRAGIVTPVDADDGKLVCCPFPD